MRFFIGGPRVLGARTGVLIGPGDLRRAASNQTTASSRTGEPGFVYVVKGRDGQHGLCKIGVTGNPDLRLYQLQRTTDFPIKFAWLGAPQSQARAIEAEAHTALEEYRRHGEWFEVAPEVAIGAISVAAQRRDQNVLAVTPDMARQIVARIASGTAPKRSLAMTFLGIVAQVLFGMVAAAALIIFVMVRFGRAIF
jgi:hypothetical protein